MQKQLKEKTDQLVEERFKLLDATVKYLQAREALALREALMMRELANETNGNGKAKFSNAESRQAEITVRQATDEEFQALISVRNDAWHVQKVQEIVIEHLNNEILNLRVVLSL